MACRYNNVLMPRQQYPTPVDRRCRCGRRFPCDAVHANPDIHYMKDIIDTSVAAGTFNTLATALAEAGLIYMLKGAGPFAVLAPTGDAFAKISGSDLNALLADKEKLTAS